MNQLNTTEREISTTRLLNAPRERVWEAWTTPEQIIKWWGPNGFTNTIHEMEVRPGGVWKLTMHGPDGTDYPNKILYREVIKPEFLSYSHGSDDEDHPGDFEVTVRFEEKGDQTEIHMKMVFKTKEARDEVVEKYGAIEGQKETINKLEKYLSDLN